MTRPFARRAIDKFFRAAVRKDDGSRSKEAWPPDYDNDQPLYKRAMAANELIGLAADLVDDAAIEDPSNEWIVAMSDELAGSHTLSTFDAFAESEGKEQAIENLQYIAEELRKTEVSDTASKKLRIAAGKAATAHESLAMFLEGYTVVGDTV